MYKVIVLLILAITPYGYTTFVGSKDHYIDDCLHPGNNPVIFYDKEIREEAEFLGIKKGNVRIPEVGFVDTPITCISVSSNSCEMVINLDTNDDGGYVEIKSGGVGYTYVTLYMESQLSKGFDFHASVYHDEDTAYVTSETF